MLNRIKLALSLVWTDLVDTYKRVKILLLAILAAIVYLEWRKIKEALLVYSGQKEIKTDNKQDQDLKSKENSDNQQADALQKQAQDLPKQEQPIDEDWYKK